MRSAVLKRHRVATQTPKSYHINEQIYANPEAYSAKIPNQSGFINSLQDYAVGKANYCKGENPGRPIVNMVFHGMWGWVFGKLLNSYHQHSDNFYIVPSVLPIPGCNVYQFWRPASKYAQNRFSSQDDNSDFYEKGVYMVHDSPYDKVRANMEYRLRTIDRYSTILCTSKEQQDFYMQKVASPEKVAYIPLGVFDDKKNQKIDYNQNGKIRIGFIARIYNDGIKGESNLVEIARSLHPDRFEFVIQSPNGQALANTIRRMGFAVNLGGDIDVHVITSKAEGTPLPLIESLYNGIYVLSTPVGESPVLLPPDQVCTSKNDFVRKLIQVESDRSILCTALSAGPDRVNDRTVESFVLQSQKLWDSIITGKPIVRAMPPPVNTKAMVEPYNQVKKQPINEKKVPFIPVDASNQKGLTYVISFRNDPGSTRLQNLTTHLQILNEVKTQIPMNVFVIEQDSKPGVISSRKDISYQFIYNPGTFNKSWSYNCAYRLNKSSKHFIFADCDCLLEKGDMIDFLKKYLESYHVHHDLVSPYNPNTFDFLSEDATIQIRSNPEKLASMKGKKKPQPLPVSGGIFAISNDVFLKTKGFDESFIGWGAEDNAFDCTCKHLNIRTLVLGYTGFHLWHQQNRIGNAYYDMHHKNEKRWQSQYMSKKAFNSHFPSVDFSTRGNINKYREYNIGIVTNSQSDELYNLSKPLYDKFGYPLYNVSGKTGLYSMDFMNHVITNEAKYPFDYMIYIDEDCFITDFNEVLNILNHMVENGYDACGMPDGGVISHRFHNPISPNLFFSIFNMKKIRSMYNKKEAYSSAYGKDLDVHIPHHLLKKNIDESLEKYKILIAPGYKPFGVIYDNFEPYYKLYFWMLRKGMRILYLDGGDANDSDPSFDIYTTELKSHNQKPFAYHSWFAREYTKNQMHNKRISVLAGICYNISKA